MSELLTEWNKLAFTKRGKTLQESMQLSALEAKYKGEDRGPGVAFEEQIEAGTNGGISCGWTGTGWVCSFRDGCCVAPIEDSYERDIVELYISISGDQFYCYLLNNTNPCIVASSEEVLIRKLNTLLSSGMLPFENEDAAHAYTNSQGIQRPPY